MKKLGVLLVSLCLVFAVAGQASAAFEYGDLVQVVYTEEGNEYASVVADVETLSDSLAVDLYASTGLTDLTDYSVGYYSFVQTSTGYYLYFATTSDTISDYNAGAYLSFIAGAQGTYTTYNNLDDDDDDMATISATSTTGYNAKMNLSGTSVGTYGAFNSAANGEMDATELASDGTMYLYLYELTASHIGFVSGTSGTDYIATISTVATPIPGAVWMLGSALLGVVGIRRKKN